MNEIINQNGSGGHMSVFEEIKQRNDSGINSKQSVADHFEDMLKRVDIRSGAKRNIE